MQNTEANEWFYGNHRRVSLFLIAIKHAIYRCIESIDDQSDNLD